MARVFVPGQPFQPSLMFVSKTGVYPSGAPDPEPMILTINIFWAMTKTPSYHEPL